MNNENNCPEHSIWETDEGWWWADEAWAPNGPYKTREEASKAQLRYCQYEP